MSKIFLILRTVLCPEFPFKLWLKSLLVGFSPAAFDGLQTFLSPLVLAQCPPNELDFGIEQFFSEENGIIDAQI